MNERLQINQNNTWWIQHTVSWWIKCSHPWPIFSILLYLRVGSPIDTIVRNFSRISSSDIFFFFCLSDLVGGGPLAFSSGSMGFVYWKQAENLNKIAE